MKLFSFGINILKAKRAVLNKLNKKSVKSMTAIQSETERLIKINDKIDQATHEIEEVESAFGLIKGEMRDRKKRNSVLIDTIKRVSK